MFEYGFYDVVILCLINVLGIIEGGSNYFKIVNDYLIFINI